MSAKTLLSKMILCYQLMVSAGLGIPASQQSSNSGSGSEPLDFNPAQIARTYVAHSGAQISEILMQFEATFLYPINFEEAPYENASELASRDVMTPKGQRHLLFPLRRDLSVTISDNTTTPIEAIQLLLSEHKSAGFSGAGDYQIITHDHRIDVVPNQVLGANGAQHPVTSVMSYPVSFPKAVRKVAETLDLIANLITQASGRKVLLLHQPFRLSEQVELGANAELPGDIIERLASQIGTTISYQLRFDATDAIYYMTVYPVSDPKARGLLKNSKLPGSSPSATPVNSFFKKDPPVPSPSITPSQAPPPSLPHQ